MPSDRTRVVLLVQGFEENPMAIGRILGLQSSESWFKGDLVYERASVRHKSNGWLLESGVSKFEVCRVHLAALLETVEGSIDNFRSLPSQAVVKVYCRVYSTSGRPELSFDPAIVRGIANLGAQLDLDIYPVPPND